MNEEETIVVRINDNDPLNTSIPDSSYIPGYVEAETERVANENQRIANETARETYINDLKTKVNNGEFDGKDGTDGVDGATFIPNVDAQGNISWTNDKGLVNPETRNIKGEQGEKGDTGEKGEQGAKGEPGSIKYLVVATLPTEDIDLSAIYLVPSSTVAEQNTYEEYVYINNQWEKIGSAVVDLANYMQKSTYDSNNSGIVDNAEKVNNHTVDKDVPSNAQFTDTTYTAGENIQINGTTISATDTIYDDTEIKEDINSLDEEINGESTTTGNGTEITLNNTLNTKLKSIELLGDTEQVTYSGKNLCSTKEFTSISRERLISDASYNETVNGISVIAGTLYSASFDVNQLPSSDYRIQLIISSDSVQTQSANDPTNIIERTVINCASLQRYSMNITPTQNGYLYLRCVPADFILDNIQIEQGSATDYEPYVGGIASPNPDYPQNIDVVTGRQEINVVGKNLLDISKNLNSNNRGIDYILNDDGSITLSGTSTTTYSYVTATVILTTPLEIGTYTYSIDHTISGQWRIILTYEDNTQETKVIMPGNTSVTFTTTKKITKYYVSFSNITQGETYNETLFIQLELGSTATEYEEYKGNTYEVNLGKNLFDSNNISSSYTTIEDDGTIKISGNSSSNGYCSTNKTLSQLCPYLKVGDIAYLYLESDWSSKNLYSSALGYWTNGNAKTITQEMLDSTIVIYGGYETTTTIKIMITKELDTSYSPYFTPIELCKIGDYQDYIRKSTGKNLFDKDDVENNYRLGSDGLPISNNNFSLSDYIEVEPNTTYTISRSVISNYYNNISEYDSNKTHLLRSYTNATTFTITTQNTTKYIRISDATSNLGIIQLEQGSTATDLEPYGVGKWYIYKKIKKLDMSTITGWDGGNNQIYKVGFSSQYGIKIDTLYSNIFNYSTSTWSGNGKFGISNIGNLWCMPGDSTLTSGTLPTWLANKNAYMYVILSSPTIEEITNTELINQLEALYNANTYNNKTYISVNGDLPAILDLEAYTNTLDGKYESLNNNKADKSEIPELETDPIFSSSPASEITSTDITNWNNKPSASSVETMIRDITGLLSSLTTTDKTSLVNAINELVTSKQNQVLSGTSEPTSATGEDGDIYLQYEA